LNWATWTEAAAPVACGAAEVRATSSNELAVTSVQHSAVEEITAASLNMGSALRVRGTLDAFVSTAGSPRLGEKRLAGALPTGGRFHNPRKTGVKQATRDVMPWRGLRPAPGCRRAPGPAALIGSVGPAPEGGFAAPRFAL
jgi:hypothetical protein